MLNVFNYYDEPNELPKYEELSKSIALLEFPSKWGRTVSADDLKPVLHIIKNNSKLAYLYAMIIMEGRWPEAEPIIIKNANDAYMYALYVMKERWIEAEPIIMTNHELWDEYKEYLIPNQLS